MNINNSKVIEIFKKNCLYTEYGLRSFIYNNKKKLIFSKTDFT